MSSPKYGFTGICNEAGLKQIIALKTFGGTGNSSRHLNSIKCDQYRTIHQGEIGGFIEKEENLSQEGDCWVFENASVYNDAHVHGHARIYQNAQIYENANICGGAVVCGDTHVRGRANIYGQASVHATSVSDDVQIYGKVDICAKAIISGNVQIRDEAQIRGVVEIKDDVQVWGKPLIYGTNIMLLDNAHVYGESRIRANALICGNANVGGNVTVKDDARVGENARLVFGCCAEDIVFNLKQSIKCQTGLAVINNEVICYKRINRNMSSLYDNQFLYSLNDYVEEPDTDISKVSCTTGLHFSHATYWDRHIERLEHTLLICCRVHIDDIVTCQEGKIRAKKCFVIGICD